MSARNQVDEVEGPFFARPIVGTILTILSGLSFLFLSMILTIVGPAAMNGSGSPGATTVAWAKQNFLSFLGVLLLSLALAVLATMSKMERRKIDQSPLPYFSMGLAGICVFLLFALVTGLLHI
ncbi:MAG: hypothetical protein JXB04_08275 [Kiritimatiellae bacterium]|nr:hypothetical protein [Kiritimatiellia bacterium]